MIVGTAGHIDHGKTALVQALTGVNADRLPEEKKRGITIELGYASWRDAAGRTISFVDVPGHEKLVRTMVAGASGIDFALLLVAADDGLMPQTREHASILSLLGLQRGLAVITKIDRVDTELLAQREQEVQDFLQAQGLPGYGVCAVSALRGDGIEALRQTLVDAACEPLAERSGAAQGFRMALDRVFSLDGIGTVVAGSVAAGRVAVGDNLCLAHAPGHTYRVRSLHSHNSAVQQAQAGERCAIGLVGLDREQVWRGMTLCDPAVALQTERVDVLLRVLQSESKPLRSGTLLHLHAGTQDVLATVAVLGQSAIAPGQQGLAQLVLRSPGLPTWWGERWVLRDASASRTVGGAWVLDPLGPARYRQTPERLALLAALQTSDPEARFAAELAEAPLGVNTTEWLRRNGCTDWPFALADRADVVNGARSAWCLHQRHWTRWQEGVREHLTKFHAQRPEDMGPEQERARRLLAPRMPPTLWSSLLALGAEQGLWLQHQGFLALTTHGERLRQADQVIAERVLPLIDAGEFDPPWVRDLADSTRVPEQQVRQVLARMARTAQVYAVVKDLYYHPRQIERLAGLVRELNAREGRATAASFRDATGLGRKRAIQILEFFDRLGYTRRVQDDHVLQPGSTLFRVVDVDHKSL